MPDEADLEPGTTNSNGAAPADTVHTAPTINGINDIANQLQRACSALHLCTTYTTNLLADASHQLEAVESLEEIVDIVELIRLDEHGEYLWRTHCSEAGYAEKPPSKCQPSFLEAFAEKLPHDLAAQFQSLMNSNQAAWRLSSCTLMITDQLAKTWQITSAEDELDQWLRASCHTWGYNEDQHTAAGRTLSGTITNLLDVITDSAFEIRAHQGLRGPKCLLHPALQCINTTHCTAEQLREKAFDALIAHGHLQQALQDEAGIRYTLHQDEAKGHLDEHSALQYQWTIHLLCCQSIHVCNGPLRHLRGQMPNDALSSPANACCTVRAPR